MAECRHVAKLRPWQLDGVRPIPEEGDQQRRAR